MIDVGDVDGPADHLVALRLAGAAVDPPLSAVGVAAAVPSELLLRARKTSRSDELMASETEEPATEKVNGERC
jgi:hypothetical protein